jgi:DNA-binding transcriptional LysR family regulator
MIDDLRSFVTVIEEASLTRAAAKLCVTQSAVSRRIQRLEELLGAELFDRNSKPPRVTALAARIYEQAVPVLRNLDRLLDMPREGATPFGTLRVGLPQTVAELVLYDAVVDIKSAFPMLDVRLLTDWSSGLHRMIEGGSIDAAVLMLPSGATPVEELAGRYMATFKVLAVQSKAQPLVEGPTTVKALATRDWILNPQGCGYRAALERAMNETARSLRLSVDTHGIDMQLRLVSAGLGLGLVPETVLARSTLKDRLSVVEIADFSLSFDIWLVFPHQLGALRRAVELLGDSMIRSFERGASELHDG